MTATSHLMRFAATCSLTACLALFGCGFLTGCSDDSQANSQNDTATTTQEQPAEEQQQDSITAHGSAYEKAETVKATTTLSGEFKNIAVNEWLKNPSGLDVVSDESSLQAITPDDDKITFTQDGTKLNWSTNGEDVHYSGVTDKELPFAVSCSYKLNGEAVDPSALKNVTGQLEISMSYANNTSATVNAGGTSHKVKEPYAMASLVSFDAEHAKNVKVDNGQVMDQDGSFVAVGMAMPGLAKSLELDDMMELPESVTITADVVGFDMPDITTMATNQTLGMIGEETTNDLDSSLDDVFNQVSSIQEATEQLSQGMQGVSQALSGISEGQAKLNSAFPNATNGLSKLSEGSEGIGKLVDASSQQLEQVKTAQDKAAAAVAELEAIDTEGMTEAQIEALQQATADAKTNLAAAQQATASASAALGKASDASAQLTQGLSSISEGLAKIQAGYEQLGEATNKITAASSKLSQGTQAMSEGVKTAISEMRGNINSKLDLVSALRDYTKSQGAFCGNASNMPASTTFVVTAKADA